eukprot:SAG31_NODE_10533_length_1127_cov_1.463035_1_plen_195_part_00
MRTLYTDQFAGCSVSDNGSSSSWYTLLCGLVNDAPWPFVGTFSLVAVDLQTGKDTKLYAERLSMPAGAGFSEWHDVISPIALHANKVLVATITNSSDSIVHENLIPLQSPQYMELPKSPKIDVLVDGLTVTLTADALCMWVVLTTAAHGRFEDNAFLLRGDQAKKIRFEPFLPKQEAALKSTLRVEHLAANRLK